jgi:mannosyltransferase OCH1-like enzyme
MQGWDKLPQKFHKNVEKLRILNPKWEHKTWDEQQLRTACEKFGSECAARFDAYEHFIQKVDFGRYVILYLYGGVVLDCDMEAKKPLDEVPDINSAPLITCKANDSVIETSIVTYGHIKNDDWFINNAFICCEPKNPYIKRLIQWCIDDTTRRKDYWSQPYFVSFTTGPIRISTALKDANMTILYPDVIESEYDNPKAIFLHDHQFSWTDGASAAVVKTYLFIKEHKLVVILLITLLIYMLVKQRVK